MTIFERFVFKRKLKVCNVDRNELKPIFFFFSKSTLVLLCYQFYNAKNINCQALDTNFRSYRPVLGFPAQSM